LFTTDEAELVTSKSSAKGRRSGTVQINATLSGITGSTKVAVTPVVLVSTISHARQFQNTLSSKGRHNRDCYP
jgi:hypothetical protein